MSGTFNDIRRRKKEEGSPTAGITERHENKSLSSIDKREQTLKPQLESCCPLATPFERRLQTLAVAWHTSSFVLFSIFTLFAISTPALWVLAIPYMIYFFFRQVSCNWRSGKSILSSISFIAHLEVVL